MSTNLSNRDLSQIKLLNIGCGKDIHPDYINLDYYPYPGVDVVADLELPWPFSSFRFAQIHANQVLEHCHNLIFVVNEAWRCLSPGGTFHIAVPWWSGEWAHGDPTHVHFFDHNSFNHFSDWHDRGAPMGILGPWKKISQTYDIDNNNPSPDFRRQMGFSACYAMHVVLQRP